MGSGSRSTRCPTASVNEFAFDGKPKDREFAENIIKGTHDSWKKLVNGETDGKGIVLKNSSLANAESMAAADAAAVISQAAEPGDALPLPDDVDKWHYVSLK